MRCPKCGKAHTRVVDSRMQESNNTIKRRRECCSCNYRFTTFERCEDPIEVIKSDGTKQRFDRNKLLVGLMRATIKRDIDTKKLNEIIDDIEVELRSRTLTAVTSHELGDMVLKRLAKIDKVAYIRFASVYRDFKDVDEFTSKMGHYVAEFLVDDMKHGRIPPQFLPIQSGVGATGNAVLAALGANEHIPRFNVYSEVVQDAAIKWMLEGKIIDASATAMTVTNECLHTVYDNMDYFSKHLTIRQSEVANSPEVIRRLGVIALNTAIECDLYGNENSSHICGSKLMNGIGGSCDYERNGYISVFTTPSIAKGGRISAIVPMCTHVDSTEHDVDVIVTEQGVADLRGKGPRRRAEEIINHCAHPDYRPLLREYLRIADKGHEPQSMTAAFAMHDTLRKKGDMRLTDFSEYLK